MTAILTLLIVLILSLVVTRAATIALTATGLSREAARFQSRSAFTGAGFTTSESESVVRHPMRRRIIMWLMLAGNAGIIAVIASVVLAGTQHEEDLAGFLRVLAVIGAVGLIWWASRLRWVDVRITRLATAAFRRWTDLDVQDYAALLHVGGEYIISELHVEAGDWLADRDLRSLSLRDEGVIVLGIEQDGGIYLGAPTADTVVMANDVLLLYGRGESTQHLDGRPRGPAGDEAHATAVRDHRTELGQQVDSERRIAG